MADDSMSTLTIILIVILVPIVTIGLFYLIIALIFKSAGFKNVNKTVEGMFPFESSEVLSKMPEWDGSMEVEPIQITPDGDPLPYKLRKGMYGDVPLYVFDTKDVMYNPEWDHRTGIYVPNTHTLFRNTYTPVESAFW